jgi:hypothetical protein
MTDSDSAGIDLEPPASSLGIRPTTPRFIKTACILALAFKLVFPLIAENPSPSELEVKAAFVLSVTRFVYWGNVSGENTADLPICVLANSEFAEAVRRAVLGKMIGDRSISLRVDPNPDVSRCRVLIVDAVEYPTALPALNAIKNAPVLTIGNGPGLIRLGGMFELFVQNRQVHFDTNLDSIRRAQLDVSSRLLELSRNLRKNSH